MQPLVKAVGRYLRHHDEFCEKLGIEGERSLLTACRDTRHPNVHVYLIVVRWKIVAQGNLLKHQIGWEMDGMRLTWSSKTGRAGMVR
jgi:hypothetical protein